METTGTTQLLGAAADCWGYIVSIATLQSAQTIILSQLQLKSQNPKQVIRRAEQMERAEKQRLEWVQDLDF